MQSSFAAADRKPRSNIHIILHRPGIAQCKNQQDILHGRARICKPGQSRNAVRTPAARCTLHGRRPRHRRLLSIKTKDRAGILQAAGFFTKNFVPDGAAPARSAAIQRSTDKNVIFPPQNRSALPQPFLPRAHFCARPPKALPAQRKRKEPESNTSACFPALLEHRNSIDVTTFRSAPIAFRQQYFICILQPHI